MSESQLSVARFGRSSSFSSSVSSRGSVCDRETAVSERINVEGSENVERKQSAHGNPQRVALAHIYGRSLQRDTDL